MANLEKPFLNLKWETGDHLGILLAKFHSLFQQGKFLDVTLSADGQFLKAHSLILCASSQFFEDKLTPSKKYDTSSITEMNLGNIRFDILNLIVDFMYTGEINVPLEQLPSLLKTATDLKIGGLIDIAQELSKEIPSTESNEDIIVENEVENAEDLMGNFHEEQEDLVVDFPLLNNRGEAVVANNHDAELSDTHNALQLQLSEDEDILSSRDTQENRDDTTAMETGDRSSVKRKKSLKDHSSSEVSEQQPRNKSLRLAAVPTKTHRNDEEEEEDSEEDSFDDLRFISTDSTASSDDESDNEKGCSSTPRMRKSVAKKPKSSSASSKEDVLTLKPFKCVKCGLAYKQKVSLTRHLKSPCGNEKNVPLFSCTKCTYGTNRKDKLRDHLKNVHKLNPSQLAEYGAGYVLPFTCCVCKRACKNADSLERHMKFHSEKDAPNFPQQLSSTNSQRRRHLIDLHAVDPSNLADNRAGHLLQC